MVNTTGYSHKISVVKISQLYFCSVSKQSIFIFSKDLSEQKLAMAENERNQHLLVMSAKTFHRWQLSQEISYQLAATRKQAYVASLFMKTHWSKVKHTIL